MSHYFVYIMRCADDTLYTGITTDLERRLREHNISDKGAKYTKARRPLTLVYSESYENRSQASQREYVIKQLTKAEKESLLKNKKDSSA